MNLLLWTGELNDGMLPVLEQLKKIGYDGVEVPIFGGDRPALRRGPSGSTTSASSAPPSRFAPTPTTPSRRTRKSAPPASKPPSERSIVATNLARHRSAVRTIPPSACSAARARRRTNGSGASTACAPSPSMRSRPASCWPCEYLNRFETYFLTCAADMAKFIKAVDHPSCRMMYDTFHANIEEKGIADAIRTAAPYTVHVHISENDRSTPGAGACRVEGNLRHAEGSWLRRLDGGRSIRPRVAGDQCRHQNLATDVRERRATRDGRSQVHEGGNLEMRTV